MSLTTIHHIGYLVKKIEKSIQAFEALGYQISSPTVYDSIREVDICFLTKDGYCIELVSPKTETSVVAHLMKKYKNSPYHICYSCEDFDNQLEALQQNGYLMIDTPCAAPALGNQRVVFLMHPNLGMIELLDSAMQADS